MDKAVRIPQIIRERVNRIRVNHQVRRIAHQVSDQARPDLNVKPVVFFNASTRLVGMSLNASFSLLTSWALRLQHVPVVHFVCQAGMSRCVQGTNRNDFSKLPPCRKCVAQSRSLYSKASIVPFSFRIEEHLARMLVDLSIEQLMEFEYQPSTDDGAASASKSDTPLPLGRFVLPSIRWVLRRHHLEDDEQTRFLYCQYILSSYRVAQAFSELLDQTQPQSVILFNGQMFPEATARWVTLQRGIPAITHEVGLQPFSAFFTTGEATAYPLKVPEAFELSQTQETRLDTYLSRRFQGQFSMAGIQFWPEIKGLDQVFMQKAAGFKQIVPIFTNVIFDTSQPHSNVVFSHMFTWLDMVLEIIRCHPDTLFVIRAHPDESRPGKTSQESVRQWVLQNKVELLPNLVFVDSQQALSSYELIQQSKFVMVYNSTIGLEATMMGAPVLCAGRARYTQLPTVFFPSTPEEFRQQAEAFLQAQQITIPPEFRRNARRFLYYQLFYSSLPFGDFIEPERMAGFVRLRRFELDQLTPERSSTMRVLTNGILNGKPFIPEEEFQ